MLGASDAVSKSVSVYDDPNVEIEDCDSKELNVQPIDYQVEIA